MPWTRLMPIGIEILWKIIKKKIRRTPHKAKLDWYLIKSVHLIFFKRTQARLREAIGILNIGKSDYPESQMISYCLARAFRLCRPPEINAAKGVLHYIDDKVGINMQRVKEDLLEELVRLQA